MLQRCYAFLAIVGLFASQLAAIPHAHEGMTAPEQQAHLAKPHFHTGQQGHHRQGHHHEGHAHHHHAPQNQPADHGTSEPTHEDSAFYCSSELNVDLISKTIPIEGNPLSCPFVEVVEPASPLANHCIRHWHPPDSAWADTPLYISLRNLRL